MPSRGWESSSGMRWQWGQGRKPRLSCVREEALLRSRRVPPCPVLLLLMLVSALKPNAENLQRCQRGITRVGLVLNPLLTAGDKRSSRWWVYLRRRWRGRLGLSLKPLHGLKDRIPKSTHYALSTAGHKAWKVKNQKNPC